ncbi:hypothetical protein QVD17_30049 [Tagetes erecta]|uniref:Uncharacterized protein n=1 Tax=Tagetes erecta TaxID=13708 RepID=A0AAD8K0U0_TARER|nr:hypothetical protein QVD17_30049 [Tagetes erecta]
MRWCLGQTKNNNLQHHQRAPQLEETIDNIEEEEEEDDDDVRRSREKNVPLRHRPYLLVGKVIYQYQYQYEDDHVHGIKRWIGILSFGEGWHNNHHTFQYSARFGLEWWQIDMACSYEGVAPY